MFVLNNSTNAEEKASANLVAENKENREKLKEMMGVPLTGTLKVENTSVLTF